MSRDHQPHRQPHQKDFEVSYGDIQVAERANWLIDRVATTVSLVLRKVGQTRAGEMPSARARRRSRLSEEKESARWLLGCQAAARTLSEARSVTMVADRDSDIYSLSARKPEGLRLIVRAAQDRNLAEGGRRSG